MRNISLFIILELAVLSLSPVSSTPTSLEGVYLKYALLAPDNPQEYDVNIFEVYLSQMPEQPRDLILRRLNCTGADELVSLMVRGNVFLTFRILNVQNETALVNTTLELNDVWIYNRYYLDKIVMSTSLTLDLRRMEYIDDNGSVLGRPTFLVFPENLPPKGSLLVNMSRVGKLGAATGDILVDNVSYSSWEHTKLNTYYRTFEPPYIHISSSQVPFYWKLSDGYYSATIWNNYIYDFDTGVLITGFFDVTPELLVLGVINGDSHDYSASERNERLKDRGETPHELWNPGFNLYDTNIKFPETSSSKAPNTGMKYFFAASLALLVLTAFLNWRWRRE
ncbi:hypothetical protein [Thermococcus sp. JdF3]|uniref:hypothetical protein n=1 Tax=Thermococcus sp. JdF3 TaxID=1638258 RepID=UPI001439256B|nr:hypothetical protein [Thermococcus sp. JdF3]NJE02440.1 hypothetical protein [Thermococcus sp. JdF3]